MIDISLLNQFKEVSKMPQKIKRECMFLTKYEWKRLHLFTITKQDLLFQWSYFLQFNTVYRPRTFTNM